MLRGITELQNIRTAILTIPVKDLPIIAVSYSQPEGPSAAIQGKNFEPSTRSNVVVPPAHLGQVRGQLNLSV